MAIKHAYNFQKQTRYGYSGVGDLISFRLNWYDLNIQSGYYNNAEALMAASNWISFSTDETDSLLKKNTALQSFGFRYLNNITSFIYQTEIGSNGKNNPKSILTDAYIATPINYSFNYYTSSVAVRINFIDEKFKACELNPQNIDISDGTINVPANVGAGWKDGTVIILASKFYTYPKPTGNTWNNQTEPLTVFPTVQYSDPLRNDVVVLTKPMLDLGSPTGSVTPIYLCLKKISNTKFKPFLFNYSRMLGNYIVDYGLNFMPYTNPRYALTWDLFNNYKTQYYGRIVSAGSNWTFNVYEPRNLQPTGTAVSILPCKPLYDRKSIGTNQSTASVLDNTTNAITGCIYSTWLDNRYVNLAENKIAIPETTHFVPTEYLQINFPFYVQNTASSSGYNPSNMYLAKNGEAVTGMAVAVYRARHFKKQQYLIYSVNLASTEPLVLSGFPEVDGIGTTSGDRILVKNQLNPVENGIYQINSAGVWSNTTQNINAATISPTDNNANAGPVFWQRGLIVTVTYGGSQRNGLTNINKNFAVDGPFTKGVTPLNFYEIDPVNIFQPDYSFVPDSVKDTLLPEGLAEGKTYFLIKGSNYIQFAATYEDAINNIPIPLGTMGRGLIGIYQVGENPYLGLQRIISNDPLVTQPLDMTRPYFLINNGRNFGLADTYADAINKNPIKIYQPPNTYFALEDFNVKGRPRTSINNTEVTSYLWKTEDTSLDHLSNNRHNEPLLINGQMTGLEISPVDIPLSYNASVSLNPFAWDSYYGSYYENIDNLINSARFSLSDPNATPPIIEPDTNWGAPFPTSSPNDYYGYTNFFTYGGYPMTYTATKPHSTPATTTCNGITATSTIGFWERYNPNVPGSADKWFYVGDNQAAYAIRNSISQDLANEWNSKGPLKVIFTKYGEPPLGVDGTNPYSPKYYLNLGDFTKIDNPPVTDFYDANNTFTHVVVQNYNQLTRSYVSLENQHPCLPVAWPYPVKNNRWVHYKGSRTVGKSFTVTHTIPLWAIPDTNYICNTDIQSNTTYCYWGFPPNSPSGDIKDYLVECIATVIEEVYMELAATVYVSIDLDTGEKYCYMTLGESHTVVTPKSSTVNLVNQYTRTFFGADEEGNVYTNFQWNSNFPTIGMSYSYGLGNYTKTFFEASYFCPSGSNTFIKNADTNSTIVWYRDNGEVLTRTKYMYVWGQNNDPSSPFYSEGWLMYPAFTDIPVTYFDLNGTGYFYNGYAVFNRSMLDRSFDLPNSFTFNIDQMMFGNNGIEIEFSDFVQHTWKKVSPTQHDKYSTLKLSDSTHFLMCDYKEEASSFSGSIYCDYDPAFKKYISQEYESNGIKFKVEVLPWLNGQTPAIRIYGAPNSYLEFQYSGLYSYETLNWGDGFYTRETKIWPYLIKLDRYFKLKNNTITQNPMPNDLPNIVSVKCRGHELPILDPNVDNSKLDTIGIIGYNSSLFTGSINPYESYYFYGNYIFTELGTPFYNSTFITVGQNIPDADYGYFNPDFIVGSKALYGYVVHAFDSKQFLTKCTHNPVTLAHIQNINFY